MVGDNKKTGSEKTEQTETRSGPLIKELTTASFMPSIMDLTKVSGVDLTPQSDT